MLDDIAARTPLGRIGEPADVARTVAFLASAEADYITGASHLVAGGILDIIGLTTQPKIISQSLFHRGTF